MIQKGVKKSLSEARYVKLKEGKNGPEQSMTKIYANELFKFEINVLYDENCKRK